MKQAQISKEKHLKSLVCKHLSEEAPLSVIMKHAILPHYFILLPVLDVTKATANETSLGFSEPHLCFQLLVGIKLNELLGQSPIEHSALS